MTIPIVLRSYGLRLSVALGLALIIVSSLFIGTGQVDYESGTPVQRKELSQNGRPEDYSRPLARTTSPASERPLGQKDRLKVMNPNPSSSANDITFKVNTDKIIKPKRANTNPVKEISQPKQDTPKTRARRSNQVSQTESNIQGINEESPPSLESTLPPPSGQSAKAGTEGPALTLSAPVQLARPVQLRPETLILPRYTLSAEAAGLEQQVTVALKIGTEGQVLGAKLTEPVGYGMDQRILRRARLLQFKPALDTKGHAVRSDYLLQLDLRLR